MTLMLAELCYTIYFIFQLISESQLAIVELLKNCGVTFFLPLLFFITIKYNKWGIYIF